jgi:hypothetical protein
MLKLHLILSMKLGHIGHRAHLDAVHSWLEITVRLVSAIGPVLRYTTSLSLAIRCISVYDKHSFPAIQDHGSAIDERESGRMATFAITI